MRAHRGELAFLDDNWRVTLAEVPFQRRQWARRYLRSLVAVPCQSLRELVDSIVVDAYGTDEQLTALLTVFDDEVALPYGAQILGVDVEVLEFDLEGDERRGLVARCRRIGGPRDVVSLADVRFEVETVAAWLHANVPELAGADDLPRSAAREVGLARGVSP